MERCKALNFDWHSTKGLEYKNQIKEMMKSKFGSSMLFGIKEPRISLLLPLYTSAASELGFTIKIIEVVRKTEEVIASVKKNWGMSTEYVTNLINKYFDSIKNYSQGSERLTINFNELMSNPMQIIKQIGLFLPELNFSEKDIDLAIAFLDKDL